MNVDVALEAVRPVRRSRRKKVDGRDLDPGIVVTEVAQEIENTGMSMTDGVVIDVDHGKFICMIKDSSALIFA